MAFLKITQDYDGRLPVFHVVKEIISNSVTREQIVKSFDSYEEANTFCENLTKDKETRDTPCGEESPYE